MRPPNGTAQGCPGRAIPTAAHLLPVLNPETGPTFGRRMVRCADALRSCIESGAVEKALHRMVKMSREESPFISSRRRTWPQAGAQVLQRKKPRENLRIHYIARGVSRSSVGRTLRCQSSATPLESGILPSPLPQSTAASAIPPQDAFACGQRPKIWSDSERTTRTTSPGESAVRPQQSEGRLPFSNALGLFFTTNSPRTRATYFLSHFSASL